MLRKALSATALATVLLTSSISANEVTEPSVGSTAKVETISAFDNIPTQGLNSTELKTSGEWYLSLFWGLIELGDGNKYCN